MPYNSIIDGSDASALIPEDVSREIIKGATVQSVALTLFRHRTMTRAQQRMPVLSLLPSAYWVNGRTGLKQTSEANWTNKYLDAEELAVIVPIPESLKDDLDYDIWGEVKPLLEEAVAVTLDDAVFFGTNRPASWPNDIKAAAAAASNTLVYAHDSTDIATNLSEIMSLVEADGFDVNGFWAYMGMKGLLRGLRSTTGDFIFIPDGTQGFGTSRGGTVYGERAMFSKAGFTSLGAGSGGVMAVCGDFSQGIIGVRQDITYKVLDQAVLQDANGVIVYNLAQQDMVALRLTCRFAFQVPNPINRLNTSSSTRYPFATLTHT